MLRSESSGPDEINSIYYAEMAFQSVNVVGRQVTIQFEGGRLLLGSFCLEGAPDDLSLCQGSNQRCRVMSYLQRESIRHDFALRQV